MHNILNVYKKTKLFKELSLEQLEWLVECSTIHECEKNSIVIKQGDETDSLHVILAGMVDVYLQNDSGKKIIINSLRPCDVFGELESLGNISRQVSIIAKSKCVFAVISRQTFMETMLAETTVNQRVIELLVKRIQELTEDLSSVALDDVYHRVVRVMHKHATEVNGKLVTERLTQQDIANRVGATREMVHCILKELKAGDYISIEGKQITIEKKLPPGW